jgi:molybdenum cofactor cytidylyltransferase
MHLGEDSVVQRSKLGHTLLQTRRVMHPHPTLIVIAEPAAMPRQQLGDSVMRAFSPVEHMLEMLLPLGLPLVLVCDERSGACAQSVLPHRDVLPMAFRHTQAADQQVEAFVAGVLATANSPGWVLLPGTLPTLQAGTVLKVANALAHYTLCHAAYRQQRGVPMGFSSELFSELIQLSTWRDLERLHSRYPAQALAVDDAGVLMNDTLNIPSLSALPLPHGRNGHKAIRNG